jgi:hypothetical protein
MPGPFVSETAFPITVKYVESKNKAGLPIIVIVRSKDIEQRYKDQVKTITTQWIQPNWKQSNDLIRRATKFDADAGERVLDWPLYKTIILETFMKEWDIELNGKLVPCIPENIAQLDTNIASALVDEFLVKTTPSEQELGN